MTPGNSPASATPSRNRSASSVAALGANPIATATIPHDTAMRASQRRAPNRSRARLEGTSTRTYPMKKMPDANPNMLAVNCRSALRSVLAMPRLVRSR